MLCLLNWYCVQHIPVSQDYSSVPFTEMLSKRPLLYSSFQQYKKHQHPCLKSVGASAQAYLYRLWDLKAISELQDSSYSWSIFFRETYLMDGQTKQQWGGPFDSRLSAVPCSYELSARRLLATAFWQAILVFGHTWGGSWRKFVWYEAWVSPW